MNVLSIENNFSQDAQRYLHQIAKVDGFKLNAFNLFSSEIIGRGFRSV